MSVTIKDGAMVVLAAGGLIAFATTAEFGLPAFAVGAGMSIISGALAVNKDEHKHPPHVSRSPRTRRPVALTDSTRDL
jgi:hypothetical protein